MCVCVGKTESGRRVRWVAGLPDARPAPVRRVLLSLFGCTRGFYEERLDAIKRTAVFLKLTAVYTSIIHKQFTDLNVKFNK